MIKRFDTSKIPNDVFGLSKEEKQDLLKDIQNHGFEVFLDNESEIKLFKFENESEIRNSGLYSDEEVDYIHAAAFQTVLSKRYYLFENGKDIIGLKIEKILCG